MQGREKGILSLAKETFRKSGLLFEQEIDAEFLFRFEAGWCSWVAEIRKSLGELAGVDTRGKFNPYLASKLWAHLEANQNVRVDLDRTSISISTDTGGYRPFDENLSRRYDHAVESAISGNRFELQNTMVEVAMEARLTARIQSELVRAARVYQIVPVGDDLWSEFSLRQIDDQLVNLRNYVLSGKPIPSFIWSRVRYLETKMNHGVHRVLRPHAAGKSDGVTRKPTHFRLRPTTRVRTWTIYFLTRRGSGTMTEDLAVDLWNHHFKDSLESRNYRRDRYRLLAYPSKKRVIS